MKKRFSGFLCLILALTAMLPACSSSLAAVDKTDEKETEEVVVSETLVQETTEETKETAEKNEEEKQTEEKKNIMQKKDPSLDDTFTVLMIGNSFSSFYIDELYEMAKGAGIKMRLCRVYYSGCSVEQHWTWFQKDEGNYKYYIYDEKGRRTKENFSLKNALRQENWDVISLQQYCSPYRTTSYEKLVETTQSYTKNLFDYMKEQFPYTKFYWHQTWAFEVGYTNENGSVSTVERQAEMHDYIHRVGNLVVDENKVSLVPTGDAWALARAIPIIGDTLCIGTDKGDGAGDHYHDGNTGGGQYLNACVWFEVLTGKSCIGNTWRPDYALDFEKIPELQKAAHQAVAAIYGANYAK